MTLRNGLVAEYHFSGNANDSSGNGNDGTVTGATLTTDKNGTPNQAYDFDGNGDYITINDNSDTFDMSSTKSLTFNTWLKMPNGQTGVSNVVDKRTTSFRSGWQLFLRQENQSGDGAFSLASATSSNVGRVIIPKSAITYGQWQMITCIYDHTVGTYGQVKVYLNGVLFDVSNATAHPANGSAPLQIGRRSDGTNTNNLKGQLDEVKFYNRVLTDTEVLQLYYAYDSEDSRIGTLNEGLIYGSHFDNGTATDWTGNNNNGTVNGATATTDKNGNSNSALDFDGVNDSVGTTFANYDLSQGFTINFNLKSSDTNNAKIIYGQLEEAGTNDKQLVMWSRNPTNNKMNCYVKNTSSFPTLVSNTSFNDGNWHSWAFMYDPGKKEVRLYCDGALESSASQTLSSFTINQLGYFMATNNRGSIAGYTSGTMDEPRIYNRALTDYEVYQLYLGYDSEGSYQDTLTTGAQLYYSYDNIVSGDTLTNGLVAYYPFSGNANDSSGNEFNGTVTGATLTADKNGVNNQAYDFDGTNDVIKYNNGNVGIVNSSARSVSLWVYSDGDGATQDVFSLNSGNVSHVSMGLQLKNQDGDGTGDGLNARFFYHDSSGTFRSSSFPDGFPVNQWVHVVLVYQQNSTCSMYVNNSLFNSYSGTGTFRTDGDIINIGDRGDNATNFDGKIDEVRIYDRALSTSEISTLYNEYDTPTNIVNDPLYDISGNGNIGTNNGATTGATGILNESLSYDGSNDYVSLPNLDLTQSFSISTWVNLDTLASQSHIFYQGNDGTGSREFFELIYNTSIDKFRFEYDLASSGGSTSGASLITPTTGTWYFLTFVRDVNGQDKLYVNATLEYGASTQSGAVKSTGVATLLGASENWSSGVRQHYLNGKLDETAIYNRPLFDDEIIDLYGDGTAKNPYTSIPVAGVNKTIQMLLPKGL